MSLELATPSGRHREADRLLDFAQRSLPDPAAPFAVLDARGIPDPTAGHPLLVTTRMTHVFALAALRGRPGAERYAAAGVQALSGPLRDAEHGGWFTAIGGSDAADDRKQMYGHAFVVLAGATAGVAGVAGGHELMQEALNLIDVHFWDEAAGACRESYDRSWQVSESYRGANSNMHAVEAFLAATEAGADPLWGERALRITELLVDDGAAAHRWRLPEHYDVDWRVDRDYAADRPDDPFRPYGVTIGHLAEWARLIIHLESALAQPPTWLIPDARALLETAIEIGWRPDGQPGLVYTVDWEDSPVVAQRMHWVAAEAVLAAEVLARRTGEPAYTELAQQLWQDVERFVDLEHGSWVHELSPDGEPAGTVWEGKPDVYHAFQALLLPDLPPAASVAGAVLSAR